MNNIPLRVLQSSVEKGLSVKSIAAWTHSSLYKKAFRITHHQMVEIYWNDRVKLGCYVIPVGMVNMKFHCVNKHSIVKDILGKVHSKTEISVVKVTHSSRYTQLIKKPLKKSTRCRCSFKSDNNSSAYNLRFYLKMCSVWVTYVNLDGKYTKCQREKKHKAAESFYHPT